MESLMSTEPEEGTAGGSTVGVVGDDVPDPDRDQTGSASARRTASSPDDPTSVDPDSTDPDASDLDATDPDAAGPDGTGPDGTDQVERRRRSNPLVLAGIVLVVIAAICAAVFGYLWFHAAHDDTLAFSTDRDKALQAAEQGSINLTTLDYRNVAQGLDRWKQSTTGDLYTQLTSGSLVSTFTKQAQQGKSVTTGTVVDGAITDLDDHAGKASALVIMRVQVTAAGKSTQKLVPLQWGLTDTSTGWKLSAVEQASGQ
jgi:Mce-associated membrane protein